MASEPTEPGACGVCGRTILRGERVAEYISPDGERVTVCALCKPAAESGGWTPAELAGALGAGGQSRRRGLGLRERLSRASSAARELARREALRRTSTHEPPSRRDRRRAQPEEPRRAAPPETESEAPDRSPERTVRSALDSFNSSRESRKVAGLIRSLGDPRVAVRQDAGGRVLVTVAWELSWYQWEVAADGGAGGVRELRKGNEVSELADVERAWNASASADGSLRLEQAAARRSGAERD